MFIHDPQQSIQMLSLEAATEYSVLVGLPDTGGSSPPIYHTMLV